MALLQHGILTQQPETTSEEGQEPAAQQTAQEERQEGGQGRPRQQADQATQQNKDALVAASMKALYNPQMNQRIVAILKDGAAKPEFAIAQVVVTIITGLDQQAKGQIPRNVILPAAEELTGLVAELAQKAAGAKIDDTVLKRAMAIEIAQFSARYGASKQDAMGMLQQLGAKPNDKPDLNGGQQQPQQQQMPQQMQQPGMMGA